MHWLYSLEQLLLIYIEHYQTKNVRHKVQSTTVQNDTKNLCSLRDMGYGMILPDFQTLPDMLERGRTSLTTSSDVYEM